MKKNKEQLKKLLEQLTGKEGKPIPEPLPPSHMEILEKVITSTFEKIRQGQDADTEKRFNISNKVVATYKEFSESVEETNQQLLSRISELENMLTESTDFTDGEITSLATSLEEISEWIEKYTETNGVELSGVKESIVKLGELTKEINLLREADKWNKVSFLEIEKIIKIIEKDIKKFSRQVYEYGYQVQVLANGALIGQGNGINFADGTNTTVVTSVNTQGAITVKINASGGGFSTLLPTETPDGSITVFTFASATAKPSFVVSDGAMMRAVTKSGVTNWTWNAGLKQVTMTIPPNEDIISIV